MYTLQEIIKSDLSEDEIKELSDFIIDLVSRYVEAEHRFLDLVFEMSDQEKMTKEEAKEYIDFLGQLRLAEVGLISWDQVPENPLPWMDYILSGSKHSNFFEMRVTDYSHSGLSGGINYDKFKSILSERMFEE